jgi:hypothetical protein
MNQFSTGRTPKGWFVDVNFDFSLCACELEEDCFPFALEEFVAVAYADLETE